MLLLNQKSCPPSGGNSVSPSLKENFWHFEIANTHHPIPILNTKQDIKYWGTVSRNPDTKTSVSKLLFLSSVVESLVINMLT